jgi:hypothetical protein
MRLNDERTKKVTWNALSRTSIKNIMSFPSTARNISNGYRRHIISSGFHLLVIEQLTWGSFQNVRDATLVDRVDVCGEFGVEEEEAIDVTLCLLGFTLSGSSEGLGGVGVRRRCLKIAIGAFLAASRCRNP